VSTSLYYIAINIPTPHQPGAHFFPAIFSSPDRWRLVVKDTHATFQRLIATFHDNLSGIFHERMALSDGLGSVELAQKCYNKLAH
jgi:hypothetical protein